MFQSDILDDHLKTSDTIKVNTKTFVEWNMNDPQNIKKLGNYRYRPSYSESPYYTVPSDYIDIETGPEIFFYTGATESDTVIESGLNDQDQPTLFLSRQEKMKMLFSLEECIKPFRPRSGINKLLYLGNSTSQNAKQYIDDARSNAARRPRYYMASKDDQFKYWTSFRKELGVPTPLGDGPVIETETQVIRGVSFYDPLSQRNYIEDACPFVVYQDSVPTNKIVIKMQTNVGEENIGSIRDQNEIVLDPLYGDNNKTTPVRWKIEALKNNSWNTLVSFDENSIRDNGLPIISADGYVEITYGLEIPVQYADILVFAGELSSASLLPDVAPQGYCYLVKQSSTDVGVMHIYYNDEWKTFSPTYNWHLSSEDINSRTDVVTKLSNPDFFIQNNEKRYRELEFIDGIRIVVQTMNKPNCTFDLIEFSPRLFGDVTQYVQSFSITKIMSDLGNSSIPVSNLLAASGSLEVFDDDLVFNENNIFDKDTSKGSIVYKYLDNITKFIFYKNIVDADSANNDYYLPIKTMYSFGIPQVTSPGTTLNIQLRDFFFFLESSKAPQLLLTNVSLSYAIMTLLDYIGFDNYVFRRIADKPEIIIPFLFVEPNQNVAEVLQKLAVAGQVAMFFDEYNNFVCMSKEYILPESEDERQTDSLLVGQETAFDENNNHYLINDYIYSELDLPNNQEPGCYINLSNNCIYIYRNDLWENIGEVKKIQKPNIVSFSSREKKVYNAGQINYTARYIQRSVGTTAAALNIDEYKNYIYKPVLLWEAQGTENRQTINEIAGQMAGRVLGAIPLNSNITDSPPYALDGNIYNNIIDVGENVYWMTNYQGYFYANGEIIKYDAIEYIVTGLPQPVWIKNNLEYQSYFSNLKFNGKMYPTGRIRIYTDPEFEVVSGQVKIKDANPIAIHGRGQFGTTITNHSAGFLNDSHWLNDENVYGCFQEASAYLFNSSEYLNYPTTLSNNNSGKVKVVSNVTFDANVLAKQSIRTGIIKNYLTDKHFTENEFAYKKTTEPGSVQSSAFILKGPEISTSINPSNFISYVYKDFVDANGASIPYKHYGTRMRIIGNINSGANTSQTPLLSFPIYSGDSSTNSPTPNITSPDQQEVLRGGSGGIAFNIDKQKNTGYYFEIVALSASNINDFNNSNTPNVVNYNILSSPRATRSGNIVRVYTDKEVNYSIGQPIVIAGLSVPQFNGEFSITNIYGNKKSFEYKINTIPTETQSTTGGTVSAYTLNNTNIANIFFYKVLSDNKSSKILSYQRSSNRLNINLNNNRFRAGEVVTITTPEISGTYTIITSTNNQIVVPSTGPNTIPTPVPSSVDNISLSYPSAIPYKLWSGLSQINVDSGEFYGQGRLMNETNPTVYDLAAEYVNIGSARRFFLYINNKQVAVVDDENPLAEKNNLALFVRGSCKAMFDNVYALSNNYSQNSTFLVQDSVSNVFGDSQIDANDAMRKYALSGIVQQTYLSGISSLQPPKYNIYYEEFGTVLREAAYFNILYDRAYPALYAKLMKTVNNLKGYVASGFYAWSYGADFLVFNATDFAINLDDTSGNYLKILGIAFTQNTSYTMTVEDLYKKKSNLLDLPLGKTSSLSDPLIFDKEYNFIKSSIEKYGKNEITIESPYIQSSDAAENIFSWVISKVSRPKKTLGVSVFASDNLQLGDIVKVEYLSKENIDLISNTSSRFIVYQIEESFSSEGPNTTMFLVEV